MILTSLGNDNERKRNIEKERETERQRERDRDRERERDRQVKRERESVGEEEKDNDNIIIILECDRQSELISKLPFPLKTTIILFNFSPRFIKMTYSNLFFSIIL